MSKNYSGKLNLLRMKNACIISVKGKTATKKGIFIPIEDNNLFISADEELRPKGCFVDFIAWLGDQPDKYGYTHSIRQSLPKEVRDRMNEEEKKAIPFFGNMKPYEQLNAAATVDAPFPAIEDDELGDLPF